MKLFRFTLALALLTSCFTAARASDMRFSKSLSTEDFSAAGLNRLSSDHIAILDALVRRDIAQSRLVSKEPRPAQFSDRLTATERDNAGVSLLTANEIAALDAHIAPLAVPPASGASARFTPNSRYAPVPSVKIDRGPRIHGELTLMVAAGSDDYSAYGGGIAVTLDDPASKMALTVAYSEIHSKGGSPWRYYGDPYHYRRHGPLAPLY